MNFLVTVLGLMLTFATVAPAAAHSAKDLEAGLLAREGFLQVTDTPTLGFTLRDGDGRDVSLDDFKGRVVVLNFVYARCTDVCPLHSNVIAMIQEMINTTPMRDRVQFVSIATDTDDAEETADILRSYAARFGLNPVNWVFLHRGTGPMNATIRLAERYGLKFSYTEGGVQAHAIVTHVIDKWGVIRGRYHGLKFDPVNLVMHVNALTNEHDPGAAHAAGDATAAHRTGGKLSPGDGPLIAGIASASGLALAVGLVLFLRARRKRIREPLKIGN